jgi:hypothetical protein
MPSASSRAASARCTLALRHMPRPAHGRLDDTVENWNPRTRRGTGFVFRDYTPAALVGTLDRALAAFADRERWRALQQSGMRQDHSWDVSAREYAGLYERAIRQAAGDTAVARPGAGGPALKPRGRNPNHN